MHGVHDGDDDDRFTRLGVIGTIGGSFPPRTAYLEDVTKTSVDTIAQKSRTIARWANTHGAGNISSGPVISIHSMGEFSAVRIRLIMRTYLCHAWNYMVLCPKILDPSTKRNREGDHDGGRQTVAGIA